MILALTAGLAVLVGVTLGLLGGGGSILTVPLLSYVAGLDTKEAIATSLLVVGVTSAFAVIAHARAGRVRWRTGLIFGAAGMAGAYVGGLLARFVPGPALMLAFAAMMVATAIAMLRRGRPGTEPAGPGLEGAATGQADARRLPLPRILLDGAVVGLVTGLVGAGGGFLVVPALTLLGGLPMPVAVGTSLAVITMKSFAGFAGYATTVQVDWRLAAVVATAAVLGSLAGGRLTAVIPPDALRRGFGWFVLAMSAVILAQELHWAVGLGAAALVLLAAGWSAAKDRGLVSRAAARRSATSGSASGSPR